MEEKIQNAKYILNYAKGSFIPNKPNFISITIADDTIYKDRNGIIKSDTNKETTDKLWKLINAHLETFIKLSNKEKTLSHYKDSTKDEIRLKINDKSYLLTNKVIDKEINDFYNKLINEIQAILDY